MSDSSTNTGHRRDRGLHMVGAGRSANMTLRRRLLSGCGLFVALIGFPSAQSPVGADTNHDDWSPVPTSCSSDHDVYRLDEPGTYTAFVTPSSTMASTEVRGSYGEMLATSHVSVANTRPVDTLTGIRFGVAPPHVFDVETSVLVQVEHHSSPYELVIVRINDSQEWTGRDVHPPVRSVINESGSCLIGDLRETLDIHTDGAYSDDGLRQVFLVESPVRQP